MQWLMQFWEAALNPKNTEEMAGFCDCSEKLSKQIIAEVEDGCRTLTLLVFTLNNEPMSYAAIL